VVDSFLSLRKKYITKTNKYIMKKTVVGAILGLATMASVMGQGTVLFNNYGYSTLAQVTYGSGSGGTVGAGIDNTFTAGVYYFLGTTALTDPTGTADPSLSGFSLASATGTFNTGIFAGPAGAGFFNGGAATIQDYSSGPITFVVVAYNGSDYASSSVRGHSAAFTLPGIATGQTPADEFGAGLQPFQVFQAVPEPSTFALAGLGLAGLLIFRRRK
jgi:hypothetical protein